MTATFDGDQPEARRAPQMDGTGALGDAPADLDPAINRLLAELR